MLGLKEKTDLDDEKFVRFFSEIQKAAAEIGCVFFAWSGEGHEFTNEDMDGEDMSGWLVPISDASAFEEQWSVGDWAIEPRFSECISFAIWEEDGGSIRIKFRETR